MKKSSVWILVAVIAAVVAAATTIIVLVLRARKKAMEIVEPIYDCGSCDECACAPENVEEAVTEETTVEETVAE